jgi:hypothetical protein
LLRLFAVTVLVAAGTCAVVSNPSWAGKSGEPLKGFDQKELVEVCDHYQGGYLKDLPSPYRYGCDLSDGQIKCQETADCTFFRKAGNPFEESCERGGDKYILDKLGIFRCWNEKRPIILYCDPKWETCAIGHDQPMP